MLVKEIKEYPVHFGNDLKDALSILGPRLYGFDD
jgi:hypothetical protein